MAKRKKEDEMYTNYRVAVHWLGNNYILCNEIPKVDETVNWNMESEDLDEEIYQWYLSDCTKSDVEALVNYFPDLIFSYSEKLDLYVLCVDHWGTSWDYVMISTTNENAVRSEGEEK